MVRYWNLLALFADSYLDSDSKICFDGKKDFSLYCFEKVPVIINCFVGKLTIDWSYKLNIKIVRYKITLSTKQKSNINILKEHKLTKIAGNKQSILVHIHIRVSHIKLSFSPYLDSAKVVIHPECEEVTSLSDTSNFPSAPARRRVAV